MNLLDTARQAAADVVKAAYDKAVAARNPAAGRAAAGCC